MLFSKRSGFCVAEKTANDTPPHDPPHQSSRKIGYKTVLLISLVWSCLVLVFVLDFLGFSYVWRIRDIIASGEHVGMGFARLCPGSG
jgi:hypothetical protein